MAPSTAIQPVWLTRPGEMLLTIYLPRRRWFGRMRSRWSLEWRYGKDELVGGEFSIDLAEGWTSPHYELTEIRTPGDSGRGWDERGCFYRERSSEMKIPRYQNCQCGHIGEQHGDDGRCCRCECARFQHPRYHRPLGAGRPRPRSRFSPPTKDSR